MSDWVCKMDIDGVHTYSNSAVEDLLGYEKKKVIGSSAWDFGLRMLKKYRQGEFQGDAEGRGREVIVM